MSQIFFAKKNVVWWTLFCTRMRWINNLAKFICVLKSKIIFSWNRYVYLVDCVIWRFFFQNHHRTGGQTALRPHTRALHSFWQTVTFRKWLSKIFFVNFFAQKNVVWWTLFCTRMRWINNLAEFLPFRELNTTKQFGISIPK